MAEQNATQAQYSLVHTLGVQPGIKRDGTTFESREFSDGEWCRFQRGVPKKIGGYRELFATFTGVPRGMVTNAFNGVNYVFVGNQFGLEVFTTGTTFGVGSGPYTANILPGYGMFTLVSNTTTQFVIAGDVTAAFPTNTTVIFSQTSPSALTVSTAVYSAPNTTVTITGGTISGSPTNVWLYDVAFQPNQHLLWQFDLQYSPAGGALQVLAHGGFNLDNIDNAIKSPVLVGNLLPDSNNEWNFEVLADTGGQTPTYRPIEVDGGVCVLYPFVFVYGSDGFIANNNVDTNTTLANYNQQTLTDWNGPIANQVNMASSKIVKGIPVRGGTNSPSGLFWATDSLIRVSFTGAATLYWRYDIISSQISTMSSSCFVEMDGIYYWMGVDRFYQYNGAVSVLPNDKNVNWLFDNINFVQRQKVWATKVPRYNEIWFFYPRGDATECTDAIIYNVKDKIWYDAGQAPGSRRSCGYTTEIFPTPIWAGWEELQTYSPPFTVVANPAALSPANNNQIYINGDVTTTFGAGDYISLTNNDPTPTVFKILTSQFIFTSAVTATNPDGVTLITVAENFDPVQQPGDLVYYIEGGFPLWQHEFGTNRITFNEETAITSSITTCDISWVGGTPSQDSPSGVNRRMHLRRVEPDFVQTGEMTMTVLGRKFARGSIENSGPFPFDPDTGKIDLRVEHREIKLKFESNVLDGNFEMGRILITAEYGDERP
jgi:hypothetical protein